MLDRPLNLDLAGAIEPHTDPIHSFQSARAPLPSTGVHPMVIKIALSAIAWFLAVTWISFAGTFGADIALTMVAGSFLMFLTLFLLSFSMVVGDRRWQQRKTSFSEFLKADVAIDSYTMRGRDVLINIVLLPVTLAVGGTLIGLVWLSVRVGW
jgi:hypothetical protein